MIHNLFAVYRILRSDTVNYKQEAGIKWKLVFRGTFSDFENNTKRNLCCSLANGHYAEIVNKTTSQKKGL